MALDRTFIQRSRERSSEEKAIYHQVTGAGRSRVLRQFVGLTEDDVKQIHGLLDQALQARVDKT